MAKKSQPTREECIAMLLTLQKPETRNPESLKQSIKTRIIDNVIFRQSPRPLSKNVRGKVEQGQTLNYQDLRKIAYSCVFLGPNEISRGDNEETDGIRLGSFFNYHSNTQPGTFRKYHEKIFGQPPQEPDPITIMRVKTRLQKTFIKEYLEK